ncbi:hypothetical protein GCM10007036_10560 [Alsobacter metallidurans]|uniref:DUF7146 domain-containing protein n=1 Tax=Alsobacter metallidurans TaxID=340221 RepID=A0A917MGU1_9HYPH|nr:hypothetical protein [Alsobacter metallidurans]GGH12591.1 hypothetical protein GCM10007036_10560 [Alsobacter metallidurans]
MRSSRDLDDVRDALLASAEALVCDILGEQPNRALSRPGRDLRWYRKGSFALVLSGPKAGFWHDKEGGQGKDLLGLIQMRVTSGSFPEALAWARRWLGMPEPDQETPEQRAAWAAGAAKRQAEREARREAREAELAADKAARIAEAQRRWQRAQPIAGTVAETYLLRTRAVAAPAQGWPDAARFDPITQALILAVFDEAGQTCAVQSIYLTRDAQKRPDATGVSKRSHGVIAGRAVILPGLGAEGEILAAEGPETGLTAWAATGLETRIALGGISGLQPDAGRPFVVLREHDRPGAPSRLKIEARIEEWRSEGCRIVEAWPWASAPDGAKDFNDLAQLEGSESVRARITDAIASAEETQPRSGPAETPVPDWWQAPTMRADQASAALAGPMEAFWRGVEGDSAARLRFKLEADEMPAWRRSEHRGRQQLMRVDLGAGKTETALRGALAFTDGEHAGHSAKDRPDVPRRVVFFVNDHKLGEDLHRRANAMQPGCAQLWRGLERPDPKDPSVTMCRRVADFHEVKAAGGKIDHLCGSNARGYCPFHPKSNSGESPCAYKTQGDAGSPIVVLAGPSALTQAPPGKIRRKATDWQGEVVSVDPFDAVVVDETRPADLMGGLSEKPDKLGLATLQRPLRNSEDAKRPVDWQTLEHQNERLGRLAELLKRVAQDKSRVRISLGELRGLGMTAHDFREFRLAVFSLARDVPNASDLTGPALHKALADIVKWNRPLFAIAKLAFCVAQALEDNAGNDDAALEVGQIEAEGGDEPAFILGWKEDLDEAYRNAPVLVLDGTGDPELLKPWLPRLTVAADVKVASPAAAEIHQTYDQTNGYRGWTPQGDATAEDATKQDRTAENNLQRLARMLDGLVREHGDVAAIVPQAAEAWLIDHWNGRPPCKLAHFGAIRGYDGFRAVRCLVVWSRPQAGPLEYERMAAVHRGSWGPSVGKGKWFEKQPSAYLLSDGTARVAEADRHPDELAERFRWQTTEAELIQAVGRARAVRRSAETPLLVIVGTSVPLPLQVDELVRTADLFAEATPVDDLIFKGVLPAEGRGKWAFWAAALGGKADAWRGFFRDRPDVDRRWQTALRRRNAHRSISMGESPSESISDQWSEWTVRATPQDRYRAEICLQGVAAGDEAAARAKLASVGLKPAEIRPGKATTRATVARSEQQQEQQAGHSPQAGIVPQGNNAPANKSRADTVLSFEPSSKPAESIAWPPDLEPAVVAIPVSFAPPAAQAPIPRPAPFYGLPSRILELADLWDEEASQPLKPAANWG